MSDDEGPAGLFFKRKCACFFCKTVGEHPTFVVAGGSAYVRACDACSVPKMIDGHLEGAVLEKLT